VGHRTGPVTSISSGEPSLAGAVFLYAWTSYDVQDQFLFVSSPFLSFFRVEKIHADTSISFSPGTLQIHLAESSSLFLLLLIRSAGSAIAFYLKAFF